MSGADRGAERRTKVRGVVLAGGLGTRLDPLTRVTNKHLLPVYDRPMVFHPIARLVEAGVTDVLLVTGDQTAGDFVRVLRDGRELGLTRLRYEYQRGNGGIADALRLAEDFAAGGPIAVILGDNVFHDDLSAAVRRFERDPRGAVVFLKEVPDAARFGVAEVVGGRVVSIEEKPASPRSSLAVTGIYLYDADVFRHVRGLAPSARGELEITDVNLAYLRDGRLRHETLPGDWTDAGTFESLARANEIARRRRLWTAAPSERAHAP
jgi:glucose-1-phosphate thymidylyltransferase